MRWMIIFLLPLCLLGHAARAGREVRGESMPVCPRYPKATLARVNLNIATTELTRRSIFRVNWTSDRRIGTRKTLRTSSR